ncbi:MAG: hypothetical protein V3V08_22805 [Nannocystaceae bacterium]
MNANLWAANTTMVFVGFGTFALMLVYVAFSMHRTVRHEVRENRVRHVDGAS